MVVGTETVPVPVPVEPDVPTPVPVPDPEPDADGQDSETPKTGNFTGSEIDANGVPAGTANEIFTPPSNVTVTVQVSAAAADGNRARPASRPIVPPKRLA
ncbi:MAG: hypothetical protein QOE61_4244 [Micromonosporaceae bacterium]|nr:hypothetical protein [Micromonosporaceae bacterium]